MEIKYTCESFNIFKDRSKRLGDGDIRKRFISELTNENNTMVSKDNNLVLEKGVKNIVYHELGLKGAIKRGVSKVSVIADLGIIKRIGKGDISIGVEIKSDKDTTTRLKKQMEIYFNYFDYVYILTTPGMVSGVLEVVNELKKEDVKYTKIGIIIYHQEKDKFEVIKESIENKSNGEGYEWIKLLWNEELVQSLMLLGEYNLDKMNGYYYKRDRVKRLEDLFKNRDKYEDSYKDLMKFKKVSHLVYNQFLFRASTKLKGITLTRHEWGKDVREEGDTIHIESISSTKLKKGKVKLLDSTMDKEELNRRVRSYWADSIREVQGTYENLSKYTVELRLNKGILHEDIYKELEETLDRMYDLWGKVEKESDLIYSKQLKDIEQGIKEYQRESDYVKYFNEIFKQTIDTLNDVINEFKELDSKVMRLLYS